MTFCPISFGYPTEHVDVRVTHHVYSFWPRIGKSSRLLNTCRENEHDVDRNLVWERGDTGKINIILSRGALE